MELEWDERKRQEALRERGLDFASVAVAVAVAVAEAVADWDAAPTLEDDRADHGETRLVSLAPLEGRLCGVAWCIRDDRLRVISLRKADDRERRRYDEA